MRHCRLSSRSMVRCQTGKCLLLCETRLSIEPLVLLVSIGSRDTDVG